MSPIAQTFLIGIGAALLTVTVLEIAAANGADYRAFVRGSFAKTAPATEGATP